MTSTKKNAAVPALLAATLACGATLLATSETARGLIVQEQVQQRVAIVDPSAVFAQMQEKQAVDGQLQKQQQDMQAELTPLDQEIQTMQQAMQELAAGPARDEAQGKLIDKMAEATAARQAAELKFAQRYRRTIFDLYGKIQTAAADVAEAKGYDLVLSTDRPLSPDVARGQPQQLADALRARTILFYSDGINITSDVLVKLDADYAAEAGD